LFYTVEEYFKNKFDNGYKPYAFRAQTMEEYENWRADFRALLVSLLGHDKMSSCTPDPKSLGVETLDGYTREKLVIQAESGIGMPLYVLKPSYAKPGDRFPVMLAPHGHNSNGKNAVCGIDGGNEKMKRTICEHNYDYGVQFVKKGFLVLCPDARGFGERLEKEQQGAEDFTVCSCSYINSIALPLGFCITGMWTWDLMRLLDYALSRDDADNSRVNCGGLSGGGLQTLWLAAMDDRVKNVIISGYFYGYKQALLEMHNCSCNCVPNLWENADMGDISALLADRNVFIETGDNDPLNGKDGLDNVYPQVDTLRRAAKLFGNENNIRHSVFRGEHKWCGDESVPWIANINFNNQR